MAIETTSPVVAAQGSTGIIGLLAAAYGQDIAAVGIVILAAICGSFIALSAVENDPSERWFTAFIRTVRFLIIGIGVSLVSAWGLTNVVTGWLPSLNGPYTPAFIALGVGFMCDKYALVFNIGYQKLLAFLNQSKPSAAKDA